MRYLLGFYRWRFRREVRPRIGTIRVLGNEWVVRYERPRKMEDAGQTLLGQTVLGETMIRLSTAQSMAAERDTLLHEVLHAVWYVMGVEPPAETSADFEEYVVARMATGVLCILRDNPKLITFLTAA